MSAPSEGPLEDAASPPDPSTLPAPERFSAFYVVYIGLFVLVFAYLGTVRFAEAALGAYFQERVEESIEVDDFSRPVVQQIHERIDRLVHQSRWVRWGGLRVTTLVLAQDGLTWLYVDGRVTRQAPEGLDPTDVLTEWMDLLPATAEVTTTLPHNALISNAILIVYASVLLHVVYRSHRRVSGLESARLEDALADREEAAERMVEIQGELEKTRSRLSEIEPIEREHSEEIDQLQSEREMLHRQLATLAAREESLRGRAERAVELAQEVRAMEDLLEEATSDLETKTDEIGRLELTLKKANKSSAKAKPAKAKTADLLSKRFRTLYKTIEVDDRALSDIAGLGDASLRLKAEESVKRLADEADNVAVRRKVGGLPDHVQVYELGFAGKGRIYYTRGKSRRFRILCVGAKNTQDADLEYLSRLPREEFS